MAHQDPASVVAEVVDGVGPAHQPEGQFGGPCCRARRSRAWTTGRCGGGDGEGAGRHGARQPGAGPHGHRRARSRPRPCPCSASGGAPSARQRRRPGRGGCPGSSRRAPRGRSGSRARGDEEALGEDGGGPAGDGAEAAPGQRGPHGNTASKAAAVQLPLPRPQTAPRGLVHLAGDLGGEPSYGRAAQPVRRGEPDRDAQAHEVQVRGEDLVPVEPADPAAGTGPAARPVDLGRTAAAALSGCRASAAASAPSGIPAPRPGPQRLLLGQIPQPHTGGKPPGRAVQARSARCSSSAGNSAPACSQYSARHATTSRAPVSRSQSRRALGPLGQPVREGGRHLLGTVEEQQQRPPGVPRQPGQPLRSDVAQSPSYRLGRQHARARAPGSSPACRAPAREAATIRPARSSARAAASATERSVARRSAPRSHRVGAGSAPRVAAGGEGRQFRRTTAARRADEPEDGGRTASKAANSLTASARSTGLRTLAGPPVRRARPSPRTSPSAPARPPD